MDPVKHFDLLFGGVFAAIGIAGLIAGAVMLVVFGRRPPRQRVTWIFAFLPLGMGLLFGTIGGIWGGSAIAQIQLEERLRTSGVTAQARVVEVERTGSRLNGRYLWQIRYEYRDGQGRLREGVSSKMERIDAQRFKIGEQAPILYDPADPAASVWLGNDAAASAQPATAPRWTRGA